MKRLIRRIGILEDNCIVCNSKESIGIRTSLHDLILFGATNGSILLILDRGKEYMIGFKFKDKTICRKCLEIMIGLEDYYDSFFNNLMSCQPAIELTKKISINQELSDEVILKFRNKGKYIPKEFIESKFGNQFYRESIKLKDIKGD